MERVCHLIQMAEGGPVRVRDLGPNQPEPQSLKGPASSEAGLSFCPRAVSWPCMPLEVRETGDEDGPWIDERTDRLFGGDFVVSRGEIHRPRELPGFVALEDGELPAWSAQRFSPVSPQSSL